MQYIPGVLAFLVICLLMISYYFARIVIYPKTHSHEAVLQSKVEKKEFSPAEWESWDKEEVWIDSPYGYSLYACWLPVESAKGSVIIAHGITMNIYASLKYILPFRSRGWNILLYDHRNHGKSGRSNTTFGWFEKFDLKVVVDWVEERQGKGKLIGTHGESMGAAIAIQQAAIDDRVNFVIEDCGFADLIDLFRLRIRKDYHLRGWILLPLASLMTKIMAGFSFFAIKPEVDVAKLEIPILFIHGEEDSYIPPDHARRLYHAKEKGKRHLYLAPGAGHAEAWGSNPMMYDQIIGDFLAEVSGE